MNEPDPKSPEFDDVVFEALALALPTTGGPAASFRTKLFDRVGGPDRFLPFLDRMSDMFDLPEKGARAELDTIDDPEAWDLMAAGVEFRDFDGGPGLGDAHGGLVRLEPGSAFPAHSHVGEEKILMLQGMVEDDAGNRYRAGDMIVSADGTHHELRAIGDKEVIYAAAVVALEFDDDDDDDDDDDE